MKKLTFAKFLVLIACSACFGQSSFMGLTPGKSTRADAERVLGQPQKRVSATLVEYSGGADATKIYVQYTGESPAAQVLRIELFCESGSGSKDPRYGCRDLYERLVPEHHSSDAPQVRDAYIMRESDSQYGINYLLYHGPPYFVVHSFRQNATGETLAQWRVGIYSKELYESAVPKSCTGTFAGVWETNRGRMTVARTSEIPKPGEIGVKGNYPPDGTISGTEQGDKWLSGEWRDSTGSGTMSLEFNDQRGKEFRRSFTGTWERSSGKGPKKGTWEGRCLESQGGVQ